MENKLKSTASQNVKLLQRGKEKAKFGKRNQFRAR